MDYKNAIRNLTGAALIVAAFGFSAIVATAQEPAPAKKPAVTEKPIMSEKTAGRDPFKKYTVPPPKPPAATGTNLMTCGRTGIGRR